MSHESGIKVEKHRSLLQKKINVDVKSLLIALGKGAVNISFFQWDDLAENGVELLTSLGLDTKPEEIASLLIIRSIKQAIVNLLREYEASLTEKPENFKNLFSQLESAIANGKLVIDSDFFDRPEQFSLILEIKAVLIEWLTRFVGKPIDKVAVFAMQKKPLNLLTKVLVNILPPNVLSKNLNVFMKIWKKEKRIFAKVVMKQTL
jgi:hypothetical protein